MDKRQLGRLFNTSQIASALGMLYAFVEECIWFEDIPDELRGDTESLFESLKQLWEKYSAYANTALDNIVRNENHEG